MTLLDSLILAVASAFGGAFIKHLLDRRAERRRQAQEVRFAAYVDFLKAVAGLAQERTRENLAQAADAKTRIAIYGSKSVAEQLSRFLAASGSLATGEGRDSLVPVVETMRREARCGDLSRADIKNLLFGG
jgi:hypothetical protein